MPHVRLVWIPTTKHKSFEESGELWETCNLLLLLLIDFINKRFLFCCVHPLFRYILQTVLLSGYLSFSICSALNPDWSFVFEWRNCLGRYMKWCPDFYFCRVYFCFHTVLSTDSVIILIDLHWAVMVKIISSYLCSPVVFQSAMRQDMSHFTLLLWLTRR